MYVDVCVKSFSEQNEILWLKVYVEGSAGLYCGYTTNQPRLQSKPAYVHIATVYSL